MRDEVLIARAVVLGATTLALIGGGTTLLVRWVQAACGVCWRRGCPGGHDAEMLAEMLAQRPALLVPARLRHGPSRGDALEDADGPRPDALRPDDARRPDGDLCPDDALRPDGDLRPDDDLWPDGDDPATASRSARP